MPQRKSSRELTWAVMLWAFLGACIWTGCGYDDPQYQVDLPNGYTLTEWSWGDIYIKDEDGQSIGHSSFSIFQIAIEGDVIFGNYIYADDSDASIQEYFILNTATEDYQWYMNNAEWRSILTKASLDPDALDWPESFRTHLPKQMIYLFWIGATSVFTLVLFWIIRNIMRFEAQIRQQCHGRR